MAGYRKFRADRESSPKMAKRAKVGQVMGEYKRGTLHSGGSGKKVTKRKQAVAIAMSEAGLSKKKRKKK